MLANWPYTQYDTPIFGLFVVSGFAWLLAFIWGLTKPMFRTKALLLQLAINTQIGVLSAFAYVWGMGTSAEASFTAGRFPEFRTMLPYEKIPVFDPSVLLGDMRFYYHLSEIGIWLYGITFIITLLGILLYLPITKKTEQGGDGDADEAV